MKAIGVIGSRRRTGSADCTLIRKAIMAVYEEGDYLVSGGCPTGADHFAEYVAKTDQIPIKIHYAKWTKKGRGAGFIRNGDIANEADILIACVAPDRMGGTEDTIKKFEAKYYALEYTGMSSIAGKLILV